MNILFIGDIFGKPGLKYIEKNLGKIREKYQIDFVVAQGENVSGRKGLVKEDYLSLINAKVDAITMGNHVWAKSEIFDYIQNAPEIVRPYNVNGIYPGKGSVVFKVKDKKIRISQFLGITFNPLNKPWQQVEANNFFDAFEELNSNEAKADYHIIDFHGEVTSEKNVFGLFLDGKVDAFIGTHTHIQTNDDQILPNGTLYISDVGMVGPKHSAIGADYNSVYQKMRYERRSRFIVSTNSINFNAVILKLNTLGTHEIKKINIFE